MNIDLKEAFVLYRILDHVESNPSAVDFRVTLEADLKVVAKLRETFYESIAQGVEEEFDKHHSTNDCSEKAVRAILAYQYLKDGSELDLVEEVLYGATYTVDQCIELLRTVFNYNLTGGK